MNTRCTFYYNIAMLAIFALIACLLRLHYDRSLAAAYADSRYGVDHALFKECP